MFAFNFDAAEEAAEGAEVTGDATCKPAQEIVVDWVGAVMCCFGIKLF